MRTGIYYEAENPEEKSPTDDKMGADEIQTDGMQLSNLMGNLRGLQNEALARGRFDDATDIQTAVLATIDAACNNTGLDVGLITTIRSCLQFFSERTGTEEMKQLPRCFKTTWKISSQCCSEFQRNLQMMAQRANLCSGSQVQGDAGQFQFPREKCL